MSKYPDQNDSKKWRERRKKAIALSVGTCLLMGIAAVEIYRLSDGPSVKTKPMGLFLPDPLDARYQRDLGEMETRLYDLKRLLFVKDAALENARLKTIREKLREKDVLVQNLETQKQEIEAKLEKEQTKLIELEKTITTLIDTVDLHKGTKEQGQEKLYRQLDNERFTHTQEVQKLEGEIARAKEIEETLRNELLNRIDNAKQLEIAKNGTINLLKEELNQHVETLHVFESQISDLRAEKSRLSDAISNQTELVRTHEDAGLEQAHHITDLSTKLTETELELEAVLAKGQLQDQKITDLEDSIRNLIARTAGDQQEYAESRKEQEGKLSEAELTLSNLLDEKERLVQQLKEKSYSNSEFNQIAEKGTDLEDELQIERTLRAKLSSEHLALDAAYKSKYSATTDNLSQLQESLAQEKTRVESLEQELKDNLLKIEALTQNLNEEKALTEELSKLKDDLNSKLNETAESHSNQSKTQEELHLAKQISDFHVATIYGDLQLEKSRLNESSQELESLKRHVDNLTGEIARLTDDNQTLSAKLNQVSQVPRDVQSLMREKEEIESLTAQLQTQLNDERSRVQTLEIEHENRLSAISKLTEDLEKEKFSSQELDRLRTNLENQLAESNEINESTTIRLTQLESRENERSRLVQNLTNDLEKQKILNAELQDKLEQAPLTQDHEEKKALIDQLKNQLEEEKALTANLKTEKEEYENELRQARAEADKFKGVQLEIETRQEWIEHLTKQLELEKETNQTLSRIKDSLEVEKGSEVERLTQELFALKGQTSNHQVEVDRLTKQLQASQEKIDYYSDVEKMHDAKVDEVSKLTLQLADVQKQSATISALQIELNLAKGALSQNGSQEEQVRGQAEVKRLTDLLDEARKENEKIAELTKELNEAKAALAQNSTKETELQNVQAEYNRLNDELAKLKENATHQDGENQTRIDALTQELDQAKRAHEIAFNSKREIEADFEARKAVIDELNLALEQERAHNQRLRETGTELTQRFDEFSEESAQCVQRAEGKVKDLHDQISQEYEKMKAVQSELQERISHITNLKADLDVEKTINAKLNEDLVHAEKSKAELEALKLEKEEALQNVQAEYNRLNDELAKLRENVTDHDGNSQLRIATLTQELDQAKRDHEIALASKREIETDFEAKKAKIEELSLTLEQERAQNQSLKETSADLSQRLVAVNEESARNLERAEARVKELHDQIAQEYEKTSAIQNELQEKINHISDLKSDLDVEKTRNAELEALKQEKEKILQNLDLKIGLMDQLKNQLEEEKALASTIKAEKEEYENELKQARLETDKLKGAQLEIESRQEWIEHLTKQLELEKESNLTLSRIKETLEAEKGSEIERLSQELNVLKGQTSNHHEEIDSLSRQLQSAQEKIDYYSDLEKLHDAKVDEVTKLSQQLSVAQKQSETITALQNELDLAKVALSENNSSEEQAREQAEVKRLTNLLDAARRENEKIVDLTKELDEAKNALAESSAVGNAKENELQSVQAEYNRLNEELAQLKEMANHHDGEHQAKIDSLTQELDQAKRVHELTAASKAEIEADYEARKAMIEELSLSLEQERAHNESLKTASAELSYKLANINDDSAQNVEKVEGKLKDLQDQISQEKEKMSVIQTDLKKKISHISDLKSDLELEKTRNAKLNEDLVHAEKSKADLAALKHEKELVLQNLDNMKQEIAHAEQKLNLRTNELVELETQLKKEKFNASLTTEQLNSKIKDLSSERVELKNKVDGLIDRLKTLESNPPTTSNPEFEKRIKELEPELDKFKKELAEKELKLRDAESALKDTKHENKELSERLNEYYDAQTSDLLWTKERELKLQERILNLENELRTLKKSK